MNYENRIIAFIDILGFRSIIEKTIDQEGNDIREKINDLNDILLLIRDILDIDKPENIFSDTKKVTQFSDSIVISFLAGEESEVFHTLLSILWVIINFVDHGILCRGGLAYGKIIHNDKVLFGPALIQAYETESKAALFPRVILDESIIELGEKYHGRQHRAEHEREYLMQLVSKDTDGMYFIDYFAGAQSELDEPEYGMPDYINNLRKIIISNVGNNKPDMKVKYGWMRDKFNRLVRQFKDPAFINQLREKGEEDLADYYDDLNEI
jgi:hypothetical protein